MRIIGIVLAAAFAAASTCALAAELNDQDAAELRQRAQELHNQRSSNPDFQPGQGRAAPESPRAAAKPARARASRAAANTPKETRRDSVAKKARSFKKIPGAFVRGR